MPNVACSLLCSVPAQGAVTKPNLRPKSRPLSPQHLNPDSWLPLAPRPLAPTARVLEMTSCGPTELCEDFFRPRLALSKTFRGRGRPTVKACMKFTPTWDSFLGVADAPILRFACLGITCPCYKDDGLGSVTGELSQGSTGSLQTQTQVGQGSTTIPARMQPVIQV